MDLGSPYRLRPPPAEQRRMSRSSMESPSPTSSWEEFEQALPTSYSAARNSSITEFDRQKHHNACQLLHSELVKLTETVPEATLKSVSIYRFEFYLIEVEV